MTAVEICAFCGCPTLDWCVDADELVFCADEAGCQARRARAHLTPAVSRGFAEHFEATAPAWFRPTADQLERIHALWAQMRTAKALVDTIRPDVENVAALASAAWQGWSDLSTELADPNVFPGPVCDLLSELLFGLAALEDCREQELADILRAVQNPPATKPTKVRRRPLVTMTEDTLTYGNECVVQLAVAS